ncbi:MAG: 2,3-epoxybenzoyl-CoA dihydrolase [Planctomycetes bacterium]|nr:2,3-epoxybenzoyl-CoA dihydrolase [Planctomycetota bacterium]
MEAKLQAPAEPIAFETAPDRYRHLALEVEGPVARIKLRIQEHGGLRPGYQLKLNSYDLGVDIELADAVQRLRFEHPEVTCVIVTSALDGIFSSGANIFMLGGSTHGFKVNFCKFTNETRLSIEDATDHSGQTYIAALNGIASGGGYELPLACKEIYLVDDRRSAVALPEVPYLGVLPGTGGLTRVVDKRKVRRDLADIFCTLAEGVKGKRAVEWGLVDGVFPSSQFQAKVDARAKEVAGAGRPERKGVRLPPLAPEVTEDRIEYRHVTLTFGPVPRTARLEVRGPSADDSRKLPDDPTALGADWWALRAFRELDDAVLRLRFNHPDVGLVLVTTKGEPQHVLALDAQLHARRDHWFVNEALHHMKRVLKRFEQSSKSAFALVEEGSCFAGSLLELALASDRVYVRESETVRLGLSALNAGALPMSNGLSRLQTRFLGRPAHAEKLIAELGPLTAAEAGEEGLATAVVDAFDWDDDVRLAIEERVSLSPDSLTGLENNLRFAGPETLETKIFGRLSAWQNWIFIRPNATGEKGALTLYGRPESAEFDWMRT